MVEFPSEWVQHFGVNLVTAYPPELGARFRYDERLRPRPSFSAIVERVLSGDPEFRVHQVGEMARIVTREGEYGAWVRLDGRRDGALAARFVGAVFLEDFASALDCIALRPRFFSQLEALSLSVLRSEAFHMAHRPRPFFYVPPVHWQGIPSGPTANWYPLDFPNNLSTIVVPPATFLDGDGDRAIERAVAELGHGLRVESNVRDEITSSGGLRGTYVRMHGVRAGRAEPVYREMAMFLVDTRAYQMRLETTMAARLLELRDVFRGVAGSFRPLPSADEARIGQAFAAPSDLFDHWAS